MEHDLKAFTDKIAVVTGASKGIGKAIALGLASHGATLYLVGRNLQRLEVVAQSTRAITPVVQTCHLDLTQDDDILKLAEGLQNDFGHIDILVHSAGIFSQGPLETAPVTDLDRQYRANVRAPYVLTQALLPMLKLRRGQIVFINSTVGLNARANVCQYAATQHALKAIADSLREEVNVDGVRVLSMFPGRTATPRQAAIHEIEGRDYRPELLMQPEDVVAVVINALGLPRTVEVTNISIRPLIKSY